MKIYVETSLERFEAWSGGEDTLEVLREKGLCDRLEEILEYDVFMDGYCTDTELNDLLWFERDTIAEWLGFSDWEDLENDGEEEEEEEEEIEYEEGVTEKECETLDDFCDHFESDCEKCPYDKYCKGFDDCEKRFNELKD